MINRLLMVLISGGLLWGQGQTNIGQTANFTANPPASINPATIQASVVGTKGTKTYYYWVVVNYIAGKSIASGPAMVTKAPDTLSVSNYVQVSFNGINGAVSYDVLRTDTNIFPNVTPSNISVITATTNTTVNDVSNITSSYSLTGIPSATGYISLNNRDYLTPQFEININGVIVAVIPSNPTFSSLYATYPTFGWTQTTSASTSSSNGYAYKATAPIYNAAAYNVYSPMWFDNAGFPPSYLIGGSTNSVPRANTIFQVSSNAINSGKHTVLAGYLTTGDGNLSTQTGYLQNGKGTNDDIIMYALNTHVAGCPAFKCDGTQVPDYDFGTLISIEADTEVRGLNQQGIGVYSACVNCIVGGLNTSAFLTFASPSLIHGDPAAGPWTAAYNTTEGSAVIGLNLNPLFSKDRTATPKSNSMSMRQCSYTTNVNPYGLECWSQTYTQNSVLNRTTPGSKVYELGGTGTSLSALIASQLHTPKTADVTLGQTDLGQNYSNLGATGVVNITLPAQVVNGTWVRFYIEAAQTINILANGNIIRDGPITGTAISSGTIGATIELVAINTAVWQVYNRMSNWVINSNQLGSQSNGILVAGTNAGQTAGMLKVQGNDGGGGTNEFNLKSGKAGTATVNTIVPIVAPAVSNNTVDQTVAVPGVATRNTLNVNTTADGSGDRQLQFMRASVPLPNRGTNVTTVSITNNNPQLLSCIAFDANHFTVNGRGFLYKAYGTWSVIVTDTPTFNFRLTAYTNSTCSTGAVDLTTSATYSATATALTAAAWSVEVESAYSLGSTAFTSAGNSIATTSTAANPLIRQFNIGSGVATFDPTTCTSSTCGLGLRVTATGGTIAGTPTVVKPVFGDLLEYR